MTLSLHIFANPTRFMRLARGLQPWIALAALITGGAGLYDALLASPADYQQLETVRIMYIHVPAAWTALMTYGLIAAASFSGLVWRHPLAFLTAKAAAPIGAAFTALTLVTGSLWGRPMWGTWWEWGDARMTSVFVLLLLYLGYMALWRALDDWNRAARASAVLALVGAVNLPIIKFSVTWWHTLHQGESMFRAGGSAIDPMMQRPLLLMAAAASFYMLLILIWRLRAELALRRIEIAQANLAAEGQ